MDLIFDLYLAFLTLREYMPVWECHSTLWKYLLSLFIISHHSIIDQLLLFSTFKKEQAQKANDVNDFQFPI